MEVVMAARLLDRQHSLIVYLTSGEAIFGDQQQKPAEPSLQGINPGLLHLEARFSHEKRMDKIAGVFARTLSLLGNERTAIEHAFADNCPPTAIDRLENARQFYDFLYGHWEQRPAASDAVLMSHCCAALTTSGPCLKPDLSRLCRRDAT